MPSGGGSQTQTTTNTPWETQQPYLERIFENTGRLYDSGDLSAIGGESNLTNLSRGLTATGALMGGPGLTNNAIGLGNATLGGAFLDNQNPYLQGAIEYAQQPVIDAWNEQIVPGMDATFAGGGAGAFGSRAYADARNRGEDALARNLSGAATQVGADVYADERAKQQQMLGLAPSLDAAGFANFDRLGQVGQQLDARSAAEAQQPYMGLSRYSNLINSVPQYGTQTTTQSGGGGSPFASMLGAGLALSSFIPGSPTMGWGSAGPAASSMFQFGR